MRRSFEQACTLSTHPTHHTHTCYTPTVASSEEETTVITLRAKTSTQNFHIVNGIQNSHGIVTASSFNYFLSHTVNILRDFLGVEIARGGARRHVVDPSPGGASSLFCDGYVRACTLNSQLVCAHVARFAHCCLLLSLFASFIMSIPFHLLYTGFRLLQLPFSLSSIPNSVCLGLLHSMSIPFRLLLFVCFNASRRFLRLRLDGR